MCLKIQNGTVGFIYQLTCYLIAFMFPFDKSMFNSKQWLTAFSYLKVLCYSTSLYRGKGGLSEWSLALCVTGQVVTSIPHMGVSASCGQWSEASLHHRLLLCDSNDSKMETDSGKTVVKERHCVSNKQ